MSIETSGLPTAIDTFFEHYTKSHETLTLQYDAQWTSPCELGEAFFDENQTQIIHWQPKRRHPFAEDFTGLEAALEITIHADIKMHYQRYWSAHIEAEAPDGHVSMLYLWNQNDSDRLVENLIGHSLVCKQNKVPFSVFFACTESDSDLYLTINNDSGEIQLESPGKMPRRVIASSLEEFLPQLVPAGPS